MTYYCSVADVGARLGLSGAQRIQANDRIIVSIRRATIDIDQEFRYYGRNAPSREIAETTANGAIAAGDTTITLTSGTGFSSAGNGNIDGDSFAWTGKSTNDLTGVTGISADHLTGVTVQEGEFAHVMREICADLSAAYYMEDESTFAKKSDSIRGNNFRERATDNLRRIAHLGTVD